MLTEELLQSTKNCAALGAWSAVPPMFAPANRAPTTTIREIKATLFYPEHDVFIRIIRPIVRSKKEALCFRFFVFHFSSEAGQPTKTKIGGKDAIG